MLEMSFFLTASLAAPLDSPNPAMTKENNIPKVAIITISSIKVKDCFFIKIKGYE
jgi:hypothetical protein